MKHVYAYGGIQNSDGTYTSVFAHYDEHAHANIVSFVDSHAKNKLFFYPTALEDVGGDALLTDDNGNVCRVSKSGDHGTFSWDINGHVRDDAALTMGTVIIS